jgi:hypothetical protein
LLHDLLVEGLSVAAEEHDFEQDKERGSQQGLK